jgi:hypothetical protein
VALPVAEQGHERPNLAAGEREVNPVDVLAAPLASEFFTDLRLMLQ